MQRRQTRRRTSGLDRHYVHVGRNRELLHRIVGMLAQQEQHLYNLTRAANREEPLVFGQIPSAERMYSTCPISHVPFQPHTPVRVLPCGHYFTRLNIDQWLERADACPLCRSENDPPTFVVSLERRRADEEQPGEPPTGESDRNVD